MLFVFSLLLYSERCHSRSEVSCPSVLYDCCPSPSSVLYDCWWSFSATSKILKVFWILLGTTPSSYRREWKGLICPRLLQTFIPEGVLRHLLQDDRFIYPEQLACALVIQIDLVHCVTTLWQESIFATGSLCRRTDHLTQQKENCHLDKWKIFGNLVGINIRVKKI